MKTPPDAHVEDLFRRLKRRARHRQAGDTEGPVTYAELEQALLLALKRDRSGARIELLASDVPAHAIGAGGGGGMVVPDELGYPDTIPATTVEHAAIERIENGITADELVRIRRDELHEDVEAAYVHLLEAVQHIGALETRLVKIAKRANPLSRAEEGGAGACLCGNLVTGAANDRLKRGLGPCCYKRWERAGRPDVVAFVAAVLREREHPEDVSA